MVLLPVMHDYDEAALRTRLERLPPRHRAAFAAACAERQLENYQAFSADAQAGDPAVLAHALDHAWKVLRSPETLDDEEIRRLARTCEALALDTNEFPGPWTAWALDAASSVTYSLQCLLNGGVERAVWSATGAFNAVYGHVIREQRLDINDPRVDEQILRNPLVEEELRRQDEDLTLLEDAKTLDSSLFATLRARSRVGGLRPVSRGLVGE
jgi:uncharacterized protein